MAPHIRSTYFKSQCPIKSKSGKLQNIDFLLTKPIEAYQYRIKPSGMVVYFIPHQYPSMCLVTRKSKYFYLG